MINLFTTELEYLKSFSEHHEDNSIIRFRDTQIEDMYSHNLTYIKHQVSAVDFQKIIEKEIAHRTDIDKDFLNIQFDFPYCPSLLSELKKQPSEISTYDYYLFQNECFNQLTWRNDCLLKQLIPTLVDQSLDFDLISNGEDMGGDFIKRRFERRSKVYLQDGKVDQYLLFNNEEVVVGHCDLFINKDVAKIEDVDVAPHHQRKGYGTAMLMELIKLSSGHGATVIYLITDHDDTAKDMYEKCGFTKVAEKTEMMFKL